MVLVKAKPLTMPNASTDTMLPTYTHTYTPAPMSASTSPISQGPSPLCGPQVILGEKQEKHGRRLLSGPGRGAGGAVQKVGRREAVIVQNESVKPRQCPSGVSVLCTCHGDPTGLLT